MVGDIYYTLRNVSGSIYQLRKWEEGRSYPLDIYEMQIAQSHVGVLLYKVQACHCPSRSNPCKHFPIAEGLLDAAMKWQHLHHWYHQDGKVLKAEDL